MVAKLEHLEGLKRQLTITVSGDDLKKAYQKKANEFVKVAKINGFRPGKIPLKFVEQKFGSGILQEVASQLLDSSFQHEIVEQKIRLAGLPQIDFDHATLKKDQPFDYVAKFEVYPEVVLRDLTDVAIESLSGEVTDDDVASMLIQMRTRYAEWQTVDRAAKLGDKIHIDFNGVVEGKSLEQSSAKDFWLELGSHSMIPGFEEGLIGTKKTDQQTLNITFPADYHIEHLRVKPVTFTVTVHEVQEPKLPALDDAFAKKVGADSVDALKTTVKEKMQLELNEAAHAALKRSTLDKLQSLNTMDVPGALIDAEVTHLQNTTRQHMHQFNHQLSDSHIKNFPLVRESYLEEAKKRVILGLLLAEVIKLNQITVDQTKVEERMRTMASQYGAVEQILPILKQNKQMVSDIEAFVLEEQAVAMLLSKARVSESKKSYDVIMNADKAA